MFADLVQLSIVGQHGHTLARSQWKMPSTTQADMQILLQICELYLTPATVAMKSCHNRGYRTRSDIGRSSRGLPNRDAATPIYPENTKSGDRRNRKENSENPGDFPANQDRQNRQQRV